MSLLAHVNEERNRIIVASVTSAVGFFLALFANSLLKENREREVFQSMVRAIQVEAAANNDVLTTGFLKNFKDGIVYQQFNTSTASSFLASPIYLKFSDPNQVADLSPYIRELALSNKYREKVELQRMQAWMEKDEKTAQRDEEIAQHIVKSWEMNLGRAKKAISAVQASHSNPTR